MASSVTIADHSTNSAPRPHILYNVSVTTEDGKTYTVGKRYSEFIALQNELKSPFALPPKRILSTSFVPSKWVDDSLIAERKTGLAAYLNSLLASVDYDQNPTIAAFLAPSSPLMDTPEHDTMNLEDALPSTLTRAQALAAQAKLATGEESAYRAGEVNATAGSPIAAAYYPYWAVGDKSPESIDFSKFDIIFYAFATPSSSNKLDWDGDATGTLKRLVAAAKKANKGTKIVLSVGGWGGCQYFHQAMGSSANRGVFIAALTDAVNTYGLAGIDIDWEYPNDPGAGQPYGSADAANLLTFFTYLRKSLGSSKIISAAVTQQPWTDSNGNPLKDVSKYVAQMTYVNIMNYDVWGASSSPGPNAPLSDACGTSTQPQASAQAALKQWKAAGCPAGKLLLGLPLYGYVSQSTKTRLSGSFALQGAPKENEDAHARAQRVLAQACPLPALKEASVSEGAEAPENFLKNAHDRTGAKNRAAKEAPAGGDAERGDPENKAAASGDLSSFVGDQVAFKDLVKQGALKKSGNVYVQANGYTQAWDDCSDTPFLYNTAKSTVVTYDDTYSLTDKAQFAKTNGMAGCFTWSLDQDDGYNLMNAIRSGLGK